jgi:putative transposase
MNRGRRGENIFSGKRDYNVFVDLLKELVETYRVNIAAYCLMPNHYHLLLKTPQANLFRSMRHLNGVYTQRFDKAHEYDGQLFTKVNQRLDPFSERFYITDLSKIPLCR